MNLGMIDFNHVSARFVNVSHSEHLTFGKRRKAIQNPFRSCMNESAMILKSICYRSWPIIERSNAAWLTGLPVDLFVHGRSRISNKDFFDSREAGPRSVWLLSSRSCQGSYCHGRCLRHWGTFVFWISKIFQVFSKHMMMVIIRVPASVDREGTGAAFAQRPTNSHAGPRTIGDSEF